jgi:Mn2+/Fe2+ NRAMP family transporter
MLVWSAVLNGIVAVPIMTVMMVVVTRLSVMGRFSARKCCDVRSDSAFRGKAEVRITSRQVGL